MKECRSNADPVTTIEKLTTEEWNKLKGSLAIEPRYKSNQITRNLGLIFSHLGIRTGKKPSEFASELLLDSSKPSHQKTFALTTLDFEWFNKLQADS